MNQPSQFDSKSFHGSRSKPVVNTEEFHIGAWLADLWEGRYLILATLLLAVVFGGIVTLRRVPVYQAESLLQLHEKKTTYSDPAFAKMEGLFPSPSLAQAEVEILKSELILGRTVKIQKLDLKASPKFTPFVGGLLARLKGYEPTLELEELQIPDRLQGHPFQVVALPGGTFRWKSETGATLAEGNAGDTLTGLVNSVIVKLKVKSIDAKPGQVFTVVQTPLVDAIVALRSAFDAAERGKDTNVIGLTFKDADPARCAATLDTIVNQYVNYTFEKRMGDTAKTRAMLESKMGPLKAQLDASESRLNQFRSRYGSVDLSKEAETLLVQGTNYTGQISALEQKKQEALRTYRENSDVVVTLNKQIKKLSDEAAQVSSRVRALPGTQQEVVRLSRDVQVNTELYTALLNNIQQLQISSAGDVGTVAVVDHARVNSAPLGAKSSMMMAFFMAFGLFAGIAITMARQILQQGLKDHRIIEAKLGIPVLVTIPHSRNQEGHSAAIARSVAGPHLLATANPDDLAIESLRSLRTSLLFSLKGAKTRTIMVTGPSPAIGKSFVCSNIAIMLAQTGAKVLLVDADLRRGNLHRHFGFSNRLDGLSEVLAGRSEWQASVKPTLLPGLDLISTGLIPSDSTKLLLAPSFKAFIAATAEAYDYVIYDVPPLLPVTDAAIIGASIATVLLVAKYGKHPLDELRTCQQRLESHSIQLHGCIFNDIASVGLGYGYQDYRYAYHYKYK